MKSTYTFYVFIAIFSGILLPLQAGLNAELSNTVKQPVFGAFVSFLIGTIALFIYLFIIKFDFSTISNIKDASPAVWIAGIIGAFYVTAVIILAPKIGTALTFSLLVFGQMVGAIVIDHLGLLGMAVHTINWQRLLGIAMIVGGVILIRRF